MAALRGDYDEQDRRVKGTEVFVGGLPRSATEGTLREIFSSCGEIVDVRIMKDQNGMPKGYGFVRFSKKEYANTAKRRKNGFQLQGKNLDVDLSLDQDTLFFGNLHKEWSLEEFEELIHKAFKDVVSVDLAMTSNVSSSNRRHLNRGFAFVRFSSHGAAARVIRIGSRTDFLLGCVVHPAINWAEKESHLDAAEMAKIKAAFVGNLPANVNEEYLQKLFEQFGEVERVAISRKRQYPVGFVHFANRIELDRAIGEMDGKTVKGPDRGPPFRIQVSVARPVADNDKKRTRDEEKSRRPSISRDWPDYLYERHGYGSHDRQGKAPRLSNTVVDITDPYESAIISLPSSAKELLLRILRLGIGTRYDIDIHCIKSLNELPGSSAVAVLNQFLISGGDKRNKRDYFASLMAKHQASTFGFVHTLHDTHLPRNPEINTKQFSHEDYDYMTSKSSRYRSSEHYPSSYYADDPPISEPRIRRYAEERPTSEPRPRQEERVHIRRERRHAAGPQFFSKSSAEYSAARQQVKFDPFTGEPYKFDPFTGEPIRPEPKERHSGSLY